MDFQKLLLSFDGRTNRQPYWIATLIIIGGHVVAGFIPLVNLIAPLFLIYVSVCLYNKRLHDIGRSGWWQLITWVASLISVVAGLVMIVPIIMMIFSAGGRVDDEAALRAILAGSVGMLALVVVGSLVSLAFHVVLGVLPGEKGENRYGLDPLNPLDADAFA